MFDWSYLSNFTDVQLAYTSFCNTFTDLYNRLLPVIAQKKEEKKLPKPWLTSGLSNSIKKKNKLYKLSVTAPSLLRDEKYRTHRNTLIHLFGIAEQNIKMIN